MTSKSQTWAERMIEIAAEYGVIAPDDEGLDWILWERTPYPLGSVEQVEKALRTHFEQEAAL